MKRGYYGIGIENPSKEVNLGTLARSAFNFDADFLFIVGRKYWKQSSDTVSAWRHIPVFHYKDVDDLYEHLPYSCQLIGIELTDKSKDIRSFNHFERAVYLLGNEANGLTKKAIEKCHAIIQIPTHCCMNVSVTGSIVMYDRLNKFTNNIDHLINEKAIKTKQ